MSIIQTIRDKGTWVIFILLGLSLISFIFMDAGKRGSIFGGDDDNPSLGSVNGSAIKRKDFAIMSEAMSTAYATQVANRDQINNYLWETMTTSKAMESELKHFDIGLNDKTLEAIAIGKYGQPNQSVVQLFKTVFASNMVSEQGQLNTPEAEKALKQIRSQNKANLNTEIQKFIYSFDAMLPLVKMQYLQNKYNLVMSTTNYVPKWLVVKKLNENTSFTNINYVTYPYADVTDTTSPELKVTDNDINEYISKYPTRFKVDESTSLDYTTFYYNPTAADSITLYNNLLSKKEKLATTNDTTIVDFINNNVSEKPYSNVYVRRKEVSLKDSGASLIKGAVFGPYLDGSTYTMAIVVDVKNYADTASAKHILILMVNPQTGQPTLTDSIAKMRIDSIALAINKGANMDSLAKQYSDDVSSKDSGGTIKNIVFNQRMFDDKFYDHVFNAASGTTTIIKANYGYHFIKNISTKGAAKAAYRMAYLVKNIEPSSTTKDSVNNIALKFASTYNTSAIFDEGITKNTLVKNNSYEIKRNNLNVAGLSGNVSELVKWSYEAKIGAISQPFDLSETFRYIVAKNVANQKAGLQTATDVRKSNNMLVISQIMGDKRYAYLVKKFGTPATIEDAASKTGKLVISRDSISFQAGNIPGVSPEPRVVGAAFNTTSTNKVSGPIQGNTGLFYIKASAPYNVATTSTTASYQKDLEKQQAEILQKGMDVFKKKATIKDRRIEQGY